MSRTLSQLVIDLESILRCEHGGITVQENYDTMTLNVAVSSSAIESSMFDREQLEHIVDALTPNATRTSLEVVDE